MVEDVVESAFIRVLGALQNGKGPTDSLRFYLATTVRREAWRWQRQGRRQAEVQDRWSADETPDRQEQAGVTLVQPGRNLDSHAMLAQAFSGLTDSWRQVLWLTEVEGRRPADVAPMLGITAGSSAALAYRARQGLLLAYFEAYQSATEDEACRILVPRLRAYVAAGRVSEGYADVVKHLEGCAACRDVVRGVDVAGELRAVAPVVVLSIGLWARSLDVAASGSALLHPAAVMVPSVARFLTAGAGAAAVVVVGTAALYYGTARSTPPRPDGPPVVAEAPSNIEPEPSVPPGRPTLVPAPTISRVDDRGASPVTMATSVLVEVESEALAPPVADVTERPLVAPVPTTMVEAPPQPTMVSSTVVDRPEPSVALSVAGRLVAPHPDIVGAVIPLEGIVVALFDDVHGQIWVTSTGEDGRWILEDLSPGHYRVDAVLPETYRLGADPEPPPDGPTWLLTLAEVELTDHDLALGEVQVFER